VIISLALTSSKIAYSVTESVECDCRTSVALHMPLNTHDDDDNH